MWFQVILLTIFAHQSYEAGVTLDSYKTPCACGSVNRQTRVVGGQETDKGEYPYMVEIKQVVEVGRTASGPILEIIDLCGAALINQNYCLTAGHCFVRITYLNQLLVYLGDHNSTTNQEINSVIRSVISVITHPKYNSTTQANDIAIIKLNASVTYQWNIQPICLPPSGLNCFQQDVIITGWGAKEAAGASSTTLQEVTVPVIPYIDCKAAYNKTVGVIDDSTVCAGTPDGSRDACQGDSGGPAVWKCKDDSDYSLAGVVSYGVGCGNPDYPGVLTNVSNYITWILGIIPGYSLCGSQCKPPQTEIDCGWANNSPPRTKRVVGGTETTANKYPWVVSIYNYVMTNSTTKSSSWVFSCAGSIISSNWVLTSAKCMFGVRINETFFVGGDYDINVLDEPGEQVMFPDWIVIHPNYNNPLLANNIAVIRLYQRITFSDYVKPVCLPSTMALSSNFSNVFVNFVGWGRTSTGGPFATKLREVMLYVIPNEDCRAQYGYTIIDSMFCTFSSPQGDACSADFGGPLMLQGKSGRWYAAGVQSFQNIKGCASGSPSGNMRITSFLPWIESVTGVRAASTLDRLPKTTA